MLIDNWMEGKEKRKINLSIMAYSSNLLTDLIVSVSYISDMYMPLTKWLTQIAYYPCRLLLSVFVGYHITCTM